MDKDKVTEGEVEIEVEEPKVPVDSPMVLEPKFKTSDKVNRIAGFVILGLAVTGILSVAYIMVAHAKGFWPF